jgi:hypothetical protein
MSEPENDVISSPPTPDDEPIEEEILTAPESEGKSFWARSLRWLLILAVIFGLGALLIMFILYIPARDQAILANQQIMEIEAQAQADLENADQKIAELEETIESLSVLEAQNVELQDELDMANLHVVILSARTDVATAQLTLAKGEDVSKTRITLSRTSETLEILGDLLEPDQRKIVSDMQERLELVLDEVDDNPYAAESDLDVLARDLLELESALFTGP